MKKLFVYGICGLMAVSFMMGCGKKGTEAGTVDEGITLEEFYEANRLGVLLEKHENVSVHEIYTDKDGKELYSAYRYGDADRVVNENSYSDVSIIENGEEYGFYADDALVYVNIFTDGIYEEANTFYRDNFIGYRVEEEEIISKAEKDGLLTVETMIPKEAAMQYYVEEAESWGDFLGVISVYQLDSDTLEMQSFEAFVEDKAGRSSICKATMSYDGEAYQVSEELYNQSHGEGRTYTLVLDPGTDKEKTYSVQVPKGTGVAPYLPEGYFNLYSDRECTEPVLENMDFQTDVTLYAAEGK